MLTVAGRCMHLTNLICTCTENRAEIGGGGGGGGEGGSGASV